MERNMEVALIMKFLVQAQFAPMETLSLLIYSHIPTTLNTEGNTQHGGWLDTARFLDEAQFGRS